MCAGDHSRDAVTVGGIRGSNMHGRQADADGLCRCADASKLAGASPDVTMDSEVEGDRGG